MGIALRQWVKTGSARDIVGPAMKAVPVLGKQRNEDTTTQVLGTVPEVREDASKDTRPALNVLGCGGGTGQTRYDYSGARWLEGGPLAGRA